MKAAFEIPDKKWHSFKAATARQGLNMTLVLNRMIQTYIDQEREREKEMSEGGDQAWESVEAM